MAAQLPAPNLESRFKILPEGDHNLEVVDGEIVKVLDDVWKEAEQ